MDEGKGITSAKRCKAFDATWRSAVPSCCELIWCFYLKVLHMGSMGTELSPRKGGCFLLCSRGPVATRRDWSFREGLWSLPLSETGGIC